MGITVIDSMCGTGKTSYMMQELKREPNRKVIWVTPFLDEIDRVLKSLDGFKQPEKVMGTKYQGFKQLILEGSNIVTTHAIFGMLDEDTLDLLRISGYELIIDEALDVIEQRAIAKEDVNNMLQREIIKEDESGYIYWNTQSNYPLDGDHSRHRDFISVNKVKIHEGSMVSVFPIESLKVFKEVHILTFLFEGQWMKLWLDLHGVPYTLKSIISNNGNYQMVDYVKPNVDLYKGLIDIYEGKMNDIGKAGRSGNDFFTFSKLKGMNRNNSGIEQTQRNLKNYFRRINAKQDEIIWTTSLDAERHFRTVYTREKRFVVWNQRSVNDYRNTSKLAYLLNKNPSPSLVDFFKSQGVEVDQRFMDLYRLSNIIQWIFRSRIRCQESIQIYIPSERSRTLLKKFLDGEL